MERTLEFGEWKAYITSSGVVLDEFKFSPAEKDKITGLLGIVGGMASFKAFPPEIGDPPFEVQFKEDGNHHLIREFSGDCIHFTFEQVDELIKAGQEATAVSVDIQKLSPTYPPRYDGPKFDDTFDSSR